MEEKKKQIVIIPSFSKFGYDVKIGRGFEKGVYEKATLYWEEKVMGDWDPEPTILLRDEDLQSIFDQLWGHGFRPTRNRDSSTTIEALTSEVKFDRSVINKLLTK